MIYNVLMGTLNPTRSLAHTVRETTAELCMVAIYVRKFFAWSTTNVDVPRAICLGVADLLV